MNKQKLISLIQFEISKINKDISENDITGTNLAFLCFKIDGLQKAISIIKNNS